MPADLNVPDRLSVLVGEVLHSPVDRVHPVEPKASTGRTFALSLADGRSVVAKLAPPGHSAEPMARNLDKLRELGVPVPQVLGMGRLSTDPLREVLIMSRLPGRDLHRALPDMTRKQLSALAREVISIQALVADLPVCGGCGYVAIGEAGTRTWPDVVRRPNDYVFADPPPSDTVGLLPRLWHVIAAAAQRLAAVPPVCFLDDLTTKNVLIDDGRLSGVVDFDVICQGDPRFHLGLTAAAVVTVEHAPLGGHYVAELIRFAGLDADAERFVDLYTAVFLTNFLAAEDPTGVGPWRPRAAQVASAALDRAAEFFAR